jgi:hypothetical protein
MCVYDKEKGGGVNLKANRLTREIHNGVFIPDGLWALHHCNFPACCNFDHIYVGTAKDNYEDRIRAGTNKLARPEIVPRGDEHWTRRDPERWLQIVGGTNNWTWREPEKWAEIRSRRRSEPIYSWETIQQIRHLSRAGFPNSVLEKIFGMANSHVYNIVHGRKRKTR